MVQSCLLGITFLSVQALTGASDENGLYEQISEQTVSSFEEYVAAFGRTYEKGSEAYEMRKSLFEERAQIINAHNAKPNKLWTAGFNWLTDSTEEEYARLNGWRHTGEHQGHVHASALQVTEEEQLDETVDWGHLDSMKKIPDQGFCGSCWAVATAKMLEARYEISNQEYRTFSVQELVNCVPNPRECGGQGGCHGATVELAMEYVMKHGLQETWQEPYTAEDGTCSNADSHPEALLQRDTGFGGKHKHHAANGHALGIASWSTLPSNEARPLMKELMEGPVAISVAARHWLFFSKGIFNECDDQGVINHAVLMVGYGTDELGIDPAQPRATNYWKIMNSWGRGWGEDGFIRILREDIPENDNSQCLIDHSPEKGIECKPYPDAVTVCGHCGLLYDSVAPVMSTKTSLMTTSHSKILRAVKAAALRGSQ